MEEKLSLLLLDCQYRGALIGYAAANHCFPFEFTDPTTGIHYTDFSFSDKSSDILFFHTRSWTQCHSVVQPVHGQGSSLYKMLASCSRYQSVSSAAKFFGVKNNGYDSFHVSGKSLIPIPWRRDNLYRYAEPRNISDCQARLLSFFQKRFPYRHQMFSEQVEKDFNHLKQVYNFKDEYGTVFLKQIKVYGDNNGCFAKHYLPLTAWFNKKTQFPMCVTVSVPEKQPLYNLDQIYDAESVVICDTIEDAEALQKNCKCKGLAFTAFRCVLSGECAHRNIMHSYELIERESIAQLRQTD
ncbi:MAG: hypothetical protein PHI35_09115 [Victivallaceae bacterium]|nr:hypothetical protein [Victivallaceae bacterium]